MSKKQVDLILKGVRTFLEQMATNDALTKSDNASLKVLANKASIHAKEMTSAIATVRDEWPKK